MNIYRKTPLREKCPNTELFLVRIFLYLDSVRVMFSNFVNKIIAGINFRKVQEFAIQVSTIRLNQKRSNTYSYSIENKMVTQSIFVKSRMRFPCNENHLVIVQLRVRLLIFMWLTAYRDNLMELYAGAYPIHGPLETFDLFLFDNSDS